MIEPLQCLPLVPNVDDVWNRLWKFLWIDDFYGLMPCYVSQFDMCDLKLGRPWQHANRVLYDAATNTVIMQLPTTIFTILPQRLHLMSRQSVQCPSQLEGSLKRRCSRLPADLSFNSWLNFLPPREKDGESEGSGSWPPCEGNGKFGSRIKWKGVIVGKGILGRYLSWGQPCNKRGF